MKKNKLFTKKLIFLSRLLIYKNYSLEEKLALVSYFDKLTTLKEVKEFSMQQVIK